LLNLDFLPIRFWLLWSNTQGNAHALTKHLGTSEIPHLRRAKLPIVYGKSRWSLRKSQRTGPDFEGMPIAICAVAHVWTGVRLPVQGETALRMRMNERELGNRRLTFGRDNAFQSELRRRVDEYFRRTGRRQRDCPQMYLKTGIILALCRGSRIPATSGRFRFDSKRLAIHQAETTVDFARESRVES
jgi:hypothetical protein